MFEKKSYINQNGKRIASWCGTLLMSGMLIFLIFWRNWDNLWCNIDKLSIYSILAALSFYLLGGVCNAGRWWLVLREGRIGISFFKTLKITFAGAFASNFLPSTIGGDVIRYFYLFKYTKNQTKGIASLIVDRFLKMSAMLSLAPLSFLSLATLTKPELNAESITQASFGLTLVYKKGFRLWNTLQTWFPSSASLMCALTMGWLSIIPAFCGMYIMATGLGINIYIYQVAGISVVTYFFTLLPISINGYGVREMLIIGMYSTLGAEIEQAAALAISTRLMMVLSTLPGAFWALGATKSITRHSKFKS